MDKFCSKCPLLYVDTDGPCRDNCEAMKEWMSDFRERIIEEYQEKGDEE